MLSGAFHQPLDLALGEIASLDCQVYDACCAFFGCRFHADKSCLRLPYCIGYMHFLHSQERGGCASWLAARPGTNISPRRCTFVSSGCIRLTRQDVIELYVSCRALDPPVGGTFLLEISVMPSLPKTCPKMASAPKKGVAFLTEDVFEKNFQVRERIPLSALAPARRAAAASEPKAPPWPLTVRAHHGARPCWRKSTC